MNLHDPLRPKIFHQPAFLTGEHTIPRIYLWVLENGLIELSMMLPLKDERFSGKLFTKVIHFHELLEEISVFSLDPEYFVESRFGADTNGFLPAMIKKDNKKSNQLNQSNQSLSISELLEET